MQQKVYMTELNHSSTGFFLALVILPVPPVATMPGVRPLTHPALRQRRKAFGACGALLHSDGPAWPMMGQPCVQRLRVRRLIRQDRAETGQGLGRDEVEPGGGCAPSIETGTGQEDRTQPPQRVDQQMALAPCDFLAPISPALRATACGGLHRWPLATRRPGGGGAPRSDACLLAQGGAPCPPGPLVVPRGPVVVDRTLGQQIMRQQVPLPPRAVLTKQRVEPCAPLH